MRDSPHLLVALTGHGFGHAAQASPVVDALRARVPELRLTLRSNLPRPLLTELFGEAFDLLEEASDLGLVMSSPFDVDVAASAAAYEEFHADWPRKIDEEARKLSMLAPDLVLADVPYLPIAGARALGIPAYALCSLNWADLYRHFCGRRPEAERIHAEILAAYRAADAFLIPEPGMPMTDLANTRPIGPCARIGADRREHIRRALGLGPQTRLVLVAMGGIDWHGELEQWPRTDDVHFVIHAAEIPDRSDMTAFRDLGIPMIDVLRASEAVITKIGYGILTEAACNGSALLYVVRDDWPEAPYGYEWAASHLRSGPISREALAAGSFMAELDLLLGRKPVPTVRPTGGTEAADVLLAALAE